MSYFFAVTTVMLLFSNIGLAIGVLLYLGRDDSDLPLKINQLHQAASGLALLYLAMLTLAACVLIFV